jgi:DNA polymerase-3 subunit delta
MFLLIHGKTPFLSLREAKTRFEKLKLDHPDLETVVVECESMDPEEIVQIYQTTDMFSPGKNILLKRLYSNSQRKDLSENLMEFLETKPESVNIIAWEGEKVAGNTRYFKFFKSAKAEIELKELNKRSFVGWAKDIIDEYGFILTPQQTYNLAEEANYDPERFVNLLEKLKLKGIIDITDEDIKEISVSTFEYDIWQLIDAINGGQKNLNPHDVLEHLLNQRVEPLFIISMLARNTRQLILIKDLQSKNTDSKQIASILKIPPFTVPTLANSARNTDMEQLEKIYRKLYNLDYEIKSGNIDPVLGLTLLMTILA